MLDSRPVRYSEFLALVMNGSTRQTLRCSLPSTVRWPKLGSLWWVECGWKERFRSGAGIWERLTGGAP